ncbi:MAG: HAMP domain-containing histidine kinase, partial [Firmicutes bacterium]|nr:HAMP domain-containing histidine kinase [Bacillota bacterium]
RVDQVLERDWLDIVAWINQLEEGRWEPLPVPDTGPWGQLSYALNQMARRLAMAQSEREMFLASVAHELKTPLTVLRANLEGLATGALRATPERWATLLREVHRLTRLVNDLLLIETMQTSAAALHPTLYRLDAQIEEVLLKFGPLADLQQMTLVGTGEPVEVEADRDRLDQVLTNIVDNALRHTPEGGRIAITWRGLPEGVECCVDDSGPGIPVAQHTLTIGNSPWGGARVCIRLPGRTD